MLGQDTTQTASDEDILKQTSDKLDEQLHTFLEGLKKYNVLRPEEKKRKKIDYDYLEDFYHRFLVDQNKRAAEIATDAYTTVTQLAKEQFPYPTAWVLCMDGRVLPVLISGISANVGDNMRIPGGNIREFVRGEDGKFMLIKDSNFAQLLANEFERVEQDAIVEVFDSHVGCAAVKGEETARGRNPEDGGLFRDILHKKEMAEATKIFAREKLTDKKRVIAIQTSFDPHNGFMYMGLETDAALLSAKKNGTKSTSAFTKEVLRSLITHGKILSTEELAKEPQIKKVFQEFALVPNWKKHYIQTAKSFWMAISQMRGDALPLIEKKVEKIYPDTSKKEIHERAMLLLTNAFSGYLHNRGGYPYGIHNEELVSVSESGYPPYEIASFVVLGRDEKNIAMNVELASLLVRANRKERRIRDRSGYYTDVYAFTKAPVPMIVQEIIRDRLTQEQWQELSDMDWSDMPKNWEELSDAEFLLYLQPKGRIPISVAIGINNLRRRMWILFDPDAPTSPHLIAHHKVALPLIASKNRMNYFIVPFVKHGFA